MWYIKPRVPRSKIVFINEEAHEIDKHSRLWVAQKNTSFVPRNPPTLLQKQLKALRASLKTFPLFIFPLPPYLSISPC